MQSVTLNVDDEVKALGDGLLQEIADVKAQKGVAIYVTDLIPAIASLASNYQKLTSDLKSADDIAYLVDCAAKAFLPAPTAA